MTTGVYFKVIFKCHCISFRSRKENNERYYQDKIYYRRKKSVYIYFSSILSFSIAVFGSSVVESVGSVQSNLVVCTNKE